MERAFGKSWKGSSLWIFVSLGVVSLLGGGPLASGCKGKSQKGDKGQTAKCEAGAKAKYKKQLDEMVACANHRRIPGMSKFGPRLVVAKLPLIKVSGVGGNAPLFVVTPKGLRLSPYGRDQGPDRKAALVEQLGAKHKMAASRKEGKDLALLMVDKDSPAKMLAFALDVLWSAGFKQVSFLAALDAPPLCKPPLPKVMMDLMQAAPEERSALASKQALGLLEKCPSGADVANALGRAAPEARPSILADKLPDALEQCGCNVGWDKLLSTFYGMFVPFANEVAGGYVAGIDPKASGLVLEEGMTWKQIAPKVFALGGKSLWIRLKGAASAAPRK